MRSLAITLLLLSFAVSSAAFELDDPDFTFDEVIFETKGGELFSPRAVRAAKPGIASHDGEQVGWVQSGAAAYAEFNPAEVFPLGAGSLVLELAVSDAEGLEGHGDTPESLVTVYDEAGTAFFSVGINASELIVGSYPLHPAEMEEVFGGTGFLYGHLLDGGLKNGASLTVCIAWGEEPSSNRVYVNGRHVDLEHTTGPRNMGPPGFEPTRTLGSFMQGFRASDGTEIGPAARLVIGRIGLPSKDDPLGMLPPGSVAIGSVRLANVRICE